MTRFQSIIIWPHAVKNFQDILQTIAQFPGISITEIIKYQPRSIKKFVKEVYSYDYAPFWHLKEKTAYLQKVIDDVYIIIIELSDLREDYLGEGSFRHLESTILRALKLHLRQSFNPRVNGKITEDHAIHITDNEFQAHKILIAVGYLDGLERYKTDALFPKVPFYLNGFKTARFHSIPAEKLRANILINKQGLSKPVPVVMTPHYQFINSNKDAYTHYVETFLGTHLTMFYSAERFSALLEKIKDNCSGIYDEIIVQKSSLEEGCYEILDGIHRASILLHRQEKMINVMELRYE